MSRQVHLPGLHFWKPRVRSCLRPGGDRAEDMTIELKENAPAQLDCKVYPLTKRETEVLQESLKNDLAKGYICHGTSSYVSPVFFIGKKDNDDKLRMVIDY